MSNNFQDTVLMWDLLHFPWELLWALNEHPWIVVLMCLKKQSLPPCSISVNLLGLPCRYPETNT